MIVRDVLEPVADGFDAHQSVAPDLREADHATGHPRVTRELRFRCRCHPCLHVASPRAGSLGREPSRTQPRHPYARPMGIVDDLLAHPGLYLGIDAVAGTDLRGAARMVVTGLPGRSGVTLDYEVLNPAVPERIRGHVEHTLLARTHDGGAVMVIGHPHADSIAILRETDPGTFELGAEGSPFPMRVLAVDARPRAPPTFLVVRATRRRGGRARRLDADASALNESGRAQLGGAAWRSARKSDGAVPPQSQ